MTINQIYQLINNTAQQCYGSQAVSTLDLENMLSLRETIFSAGADLFLNTLVDRIGKTVIRTLDFTSTFPNFIMQEFEFGAILQKLTVEPMSAQSAEWANVGSGGFTPTMYKIDKPRVYQDFFKTANAWEIDLTIPDTLFKSAFDSAEAMGSFITAIFDTLSTSINMQIENDTRLAILGFIAEKIKNNNGVVDLVDLYNDVAATPLTSAAEAMISREFLMFAGKTMRDYIKYMAKPSVLYNVAGRVRATQRDNMHILMLTEFASAYDCYVKSVLFNPEELPLYSEVEYWQGTGATAPNFDDCSKIDVDAPSDGTNVKQSGIVAVFMDREAVGTGIYDRFSAADRNNRNRYTNYTEGCMIQTFVDDSEGGVCFIVQDPTP